MEDEKGEIIGRSELTTLPFIPRIGEHVFLSSGLLAKKDKFLEKYNINFDTFLEVKNVKYSQRASDITVAEIYMKYLPKIDAIV